MEEADQFLSREGRIRLPERFDRERERKMPKPTQLPFHLCQVLEEEYINLHRQLNPKPGWEFEGDQLKSTAELARKLREAASESSRDRISKHLRSWLLKLEPGLVKEIDDDRVPDAAAFSDALNLILPQKGFYSEEDFAELRLPEATEQLVRLGTRDGELSFVDDDLKRFNRLLVEGAYPEEVSEIYEVRLAKIFKLMHSENSAALCLSGGGIRSGTFCLGIIQGLARHGMLSRFHYLSTVSGGGYTGGWLSAWINRHPRGLPGVADDIIHRNPKSRIVPDAEPVQHMREYGSFVTPKFTLLSADVWSFVTIYFRNLMLNWLVIIPLLLAALALPRLNLSLLGERPSHAVAIAVFAIAILLSGFSIGYITINRPSAADALRQSKFWSKRTGQESFLKWCLLPFTVSVFLFSLNWAWFRNHSIDADDQIEALVGDKLWSWLIFMLFGLLVHFIGWLVAFIILRRFRFIELVTVFITGPVGGLLTWLVVTGIFDRPVMPPIAIKESYSYLEDRFTIDPTTGLYATFAVPLFMVAMFLAVTFYVGLTSRKAWDRVPRARRASARNLSGNTVVLEDEDREWLARYSAWTLIVAIIWAVASLLVIFGPLAVLASPKLVASIGGISALIPLLVGKSAKTPGGERKADQKGALTVLMEQSLSVIALLFVALLIVILSFVTSLLIQKVGFIDYNKNIARSAFIKTISPATTEAIFQEVLPAEGGSDDANATPGRDPGEKYEFDLSNPSILAPVLGDEHGDLNLMKIMYYPPYWFIGVIAFLLFAFGMAVSRWVVNLNKFSLHAGYRNRIIRAFLGASRATAERKPNPFTGFDPSDNIQMHELRPNLLRERSFRESDETKSSGLVRLIVKLRDAKDDRQSIDTDVAAYLRSKLSKESVEMLRNHRGYNEPSQSLKKNLIEDLNLCLEEENFYGAPAFAKIKDSSRTTGFLTSITQQSIYGDYLIYLNRLLLAQAFPREFADWRYPPPPYRLLHIVNTTLNLVGGDNLAWQQRKAEAFSVSPLHCGSLFVGYRKSKDYGGEDGISLGTAVAISGAAVSSNMGYLSTSSAITFVLTFFNARLGWWLGNPGPAGDEFYDKAHPRQAIYPLLAEAFGLTDDKNAYVLLSDGGQFENLGLYEMVLRRNRFIVLVDGGADSEGSFEDLGNAVRKIRIDMGIEIDFDQMKIYPRSATDKKDGLYCAIGTIHYEMVDKDSEGQPGYLVYIKPAYYGNEPRDVYNYGQSNKEFPHESTADQFFDEPQFESHRRLGAYIVDLMVGEEWTGASLDEFRTRIESHYLNTEKTLSQ